MAEYIERAAAEKVASRYGCSNGAAIGIHSGLADCIAYEISKLPAADVAPVIRGRWQLLRHDKFSDVFQCSVCGRKVSLTKGKDAVEQFPYCHCGAAMKMEDASCPEHQP